jgi:tetratricopeptide (TPR) repeat protein
MFQDTRPDLEAAREMFGRAIELDPSYARAHAGLSDACCYLYKHFGCEAALLEQADAASRTAIALDPDAADGHVSRAVVKWLRDDLDEARLEFAAAERLSPASFEAQYLHGMFCYNLGDLDGAAHHFERASGLQPDDYQSPLILGGVYRGLGRAEDARGAYRRGLEVAERHLRLEPEDSRARYLAASALVALGDVEKGLAWARRALEATPHDPMTLYNLAGIHAAAGRIDDAIGYLESAVAAGFRYLKVIENDPDLHPLRGDPRFGEIVARLC